MRPLTTKCTKCAETFTLPPHVRYTRTAACPHCSEPAMIVALLPRVEAVDWSAA